MIGWLAYDYIIATQPHQREFPDLNRQIRDRIEMSPRDWWIGITDADAMVVALDGMTGLGLTNEPDLFDFVGNRPDFDDWMAAHHPEIGYCWIDQYAAAFADRAAQEAFNDGLGPRVLRSAHLPQTA